MSTLDVPGISQARADVRYGRAVRKVSTSITAIIGETLEVDTSGGARTVTPPSTPTVGDKVTVVNTGTNALTWVGPTNSDPSALLAARWAGATFVWDGTVWVVTSIGLSNPSLLALAPPWPASGYYLHTVSPNVVGTSTTLGNGTLRLTPWVVAKPLALAALLAETVTAGDSGSTMRIAIYADNGNSLPGALVLDAGGAATDSVGFKPVTVSLTLQPGVYWIGGAVQGVTTTQPQMRTIGSSHIPPIPMTSSTDNTTGVGAIAGSTIGANTTGVIGAPPATFTSTGLTVNVPRITAKVA